MLPLSTLSTLFAVCLACLLLVVLDARPVTDFGKQDVETRLLDAISRDFQKKLANYETDDTLNSQFKTKDFQHIWKDNDKEEMAKHRVKRIGIAGHENMDMMFDQLNGRRFKPAMSVSGNMGNLQSMMDRMRAMMNG